MSASKKTKKTEVAMTERQRQEAKEAKSVQRMTLIFVTAVILCVAIFVVSIAAAPVQGLVHRNTKAVTVGDHTLSAVEFNYFYMDAINNYYNNYSSLISYILKVDTALDQQVYDTTTGQTWADYFVTAALENAKSTYALYDEAMKQGFKLSEEEQKSVDSMIDTLDTNIQYYYTLYAAMGYSYPYKNASTYLKGVYGNGASEKTYASYYEVCTIADAFYAAHSDSLEYNEDAIRAYEKDILSNYNSYSFNYYLLQTVKYCEGGTKDDKGNITYSDEEKKAGAETAKMLADLIAAGTCESLENFDDLINMTLNNYEKGKTPAASDATTTTGTTTESTNKVSSTPVKETLGTGVNALFIDWLSEEGRTEGDMTVIEYASGEGDSKVINGYYVLCYGSQNDNQFPLVNVRHILVKFEGGKTDSTTGAVTYSDIEKTAAKDAAEDLLEQWQKGAKTEESFAELANKESDDGDGTTGGLYEDVYPGQMVTNFNDWCFEEGRKAGDTGIVETEYGYHVMYFSSYSDITYRDFMITNNMRSDDMEKWHDGLIKALTAAILTDKYVNKGVTMNEVVGA